MPQFVNTELLSHVSGKTMGTHNTLLPSARMHEGYGTWSVCVSGTTSPATRRNGASNRRYLRLLCNLGNVLNMAFSLKMLCSKVMA